MWNRVPGARIAAVCSCAAGSLTLVAGAVFARRHQPDKFPFRAWVRGDTAVWSVTIAGTALLLLSGTWLVIRLSSNPTGWWLLATGILRSVWLAGSSWPGPLSPWVDQLVPPVSKATIVMAVLPWPMGRLEPRWARPFRRAVLAFVVVGCLSPFFGFRWPMWANPDWVLPSFGGFVIGNIVSGASAVLLMGIAPAVLLVAAVRRRSMMPKSVKPATTMATFGAALLASCEVWAFVVDVLAGSMEPTLTRPGSLRMVRDVVTASSYGVTAMLLVGGEALRRRSAREMSDERRVEIGGLRHDASLKGDVADLIGDPTARLLVRGVDDLSRRPAGRSRVEVVDRAGALVAVVDHGSDRRFSGTTLDALLAAVELTVVRRSREAEAIARAAELQHIQREVLDSHDFARQRLERDLHDGVQQRLVAVSIEGSMLARREAVERAPSESRDVLIASIESTIALTHDVMRQRSPAVLDHGLAAGLAALQASIPLPSTLAVEGDLDSTHSATPALWFIACEVVSNVLKHAEASTLGVTLRVNAETAELLVVDDGIGGVVARPQAILRRIDHETTAVDVVSPPGGGTTVRVRVDLADAPEIP